MNSTITTASGVANSLQITHMAEITKGAEFKPGHPFLIRKGGTTDESITITPVGNNSPIENIALGSGWNCEICKSCLIDSTCADTYWAGY